MDAARRKEISDATKARWAAYRKMRAEQMAPFEHAAEAQRSEREAQNQARGEQIRRNLLIDSLKTVSYEDAKKQGHSAEWHEGHGDRLCMFGEIWERATGTTRDTRTTDEVLVMCLAWCGALKIVDPIIEEKTTLRDLAQRTFYEWQRQSCPLMNPANSQLSRWHTAPTAKPFEEVWEFTEEGDYNAALSVVAMEEIQADALREEEERSNEA